MTKNFDLELVKKNDFCKSYKYLTKEDKSGFRFRNKSRRNR